jgi:hypothetical protein
MNEYLGTQVLFSLEIHKKAERFVVLGPAIVLKEHAIMQLECYFC